jgi:hypothetical protein
MVTPRNPNSPYDPEQLRDPLPPHMAANEMRSPTDLDRDLQADPELAEGPASNARIALFAVGIAVLLGIVFYGLNSTTTHQASTAPTQVQQGTTTGKAPASPQTPSPASPAPGGANTNNANPGNAPASK